MFGPVRTTNFGKHFDVVSKPKANDLAYTSLGIKAHTDNPIQKTYARNSNITLYS